jgi:two-component system chemotaxis response regulator CheY
MSEQKKYSDLVFLIVDDIAGMRKTVKNMLRMLGVSQTLEADDGVSALAILKEEKSVGFIICDWNMPAMSGIELLEILKNMPEYRLIPFLMITAEMSEERIAQAAEVDVDSFLIKPFVANVLQDRIVETFNRIIHPSEEMQSICQAQLLKDNKKYLEVKSPLEKHLFL